MNRDGKKKKPPKHRSQVRAKANVRIFEQFVRLYFTCIGFGNPPDHGITEYMPSWKRPTRIIESDDAACA